MQVGIYNGENYNKAPGDQRKDADGPGLGAADGHRRRQPGRRPPAHRLRPGRQAHRRRHRDAGSAWLSYRSKVLTLAGEYAATKDRQDAPPHRRRRSAAIDGEILSFFGVLQIPNSQVAHHRPVRPDRSQHGRGEQQARPGSSRACRTSSPRTSACWPTSTTDSIRAAPRPRPSKRPGPQALFQAQFIF